MSDVNNSSARTWCGTLNNPTVPLDPEQHGPAFEALLLGAFLPLGFRYLVYQLESGESGTPHLQFYVEFSRTVRFTRLRRALPGAHFEQRRGSKQQARAYCMKEDTRVSGPWEHGTFDTEQGRRRDLEELYDTIKTGASTREIFDAHPAAAVRYTRNIQQVAHLVRDHSRPTPPDVTLLYGPPGCGKTRLVYDQHGDDIWANPIGKGGWYDGYDGQATALFDDFAGKASHTSLACLLRLLDRYPLQVPVKGAQVWWTPVRIFLTTNVHPRLWYSWARREQQYPALRRRVTRLVVWSTDNDCRSLTPDDDEFVRFWDRDPGHLEFPLDPDDVFNFMFDNDI